MSAGSADDLMNKAKALLDQLLPLHAPSGREQEMDEACLRLLSNRAEEVRQDAQGNVVARICGSGGPKIGLFAHKDEIALMVSRIHDDGKMEVEPVGGCYPWAFGQGPWEVLGDDCVMGVLSIASVHTSERSGETYEVKRSKPVTWPIVRIDCKLSPQELAARGVAVGSLACPARSRKQPVYIGDYVGGYGLDDKGGVVACILAAELLSEQNCEAMVYVALTSMEEIGTIGANFVARELGLDALIAVDVAPVAPEYPTKPGPLPAVIFKDAYSVYNPRLSNWLAKVAEETVGGVQRLVLRSYGSDASGALKQGFVPRSALLGFATENTHGFEVAHVGGIVACARVLAEAARRFGREMANG